MVFFDDRYEDIEEAQTQPGGLAVIAVMVEVRFIWSIFPQDGGTGFISGPEYRYT
jgi:hypothetical protein